MQNNGLVVIQKVPLSYLDKFNNHTHAAHTNHLVSFCSMMIV